MAEPMRFYFDIISPFAYLGWSQIHALGDRTGRPIEAIPVLFAAMLNHFGHKGPAEIAPKRLFTWKTVARRAHDLGVPVQPPPAHPFNPLLGLRLASLPMAPDLQRKLIDRLFRMAWVDRHDVTDAAAVAAALDEVGLPGAAWIAAANAPEVKARVKTQTAAAIEAGVFGVPTVIVDNELFWGVDSYADVDRFVRGQDPVDAQQLAAWTDIPTGAQRAKT